MNQSSITFIIKNRINGMKITTRELILSNNNSPCEAKIEKIAKAKNNNCVLEYCSKEEYEKLI